MIACFQPKYGKPSNLKVAKTDIPTPKQNELLVKIVARTVNRTDTGVQSGRPYFVRFVFGFSRPKVHISGTDFSGVVVIVGEGVTSYTEGDEIYGFYDMGLGTHANYACINVDRAIFRKPKHISHEVAVASCEGVHYGYYFLKSVAIDPIKKLLINGATGAIGSAVVQMLVHRGCEVTAICAPGYEEKFLALGAKKVYPYTAREAYLSQNGAPYDYTFDFVGKIPFFTSKNLLLPKGIYISSELGSWWQNPLLALVSPLMQGRKVKFPLPTDIKESLTYVNTLLVNGDFKPLLDRAYELEDIQSAFEYVLTRQKIGNVILK